MSSHRSWALSNYSRRCVVGPRSIEGGSSLAQSLILLDIVSSRAEDFLSPEAIHAFIVSFCVPEVRLGLVDMHSTSLSGLLPVFRG